MKVPDRDNILKTLTEERAAVLERVATTSDDDWQRPSRNPAWSLFDNLAHLAVNNNQLCDMVERVLRGEPSHSPDLDLDRFNASMVRRQRGRTVPDLLAQFEQAHERAVAFTAQLTDEQMAIPTTHPRLPEVSLAGLIKLVGLHSKMHLPDMRVAEPAQEAAA